MSPHYSKLSARTIVPGIVDAMANGPPGVSAKSKRPLRLAFRRHPLIIAFGLLVLMTLAARLWWGWHVARQLRAQEAELRARDEPVHPAELAIVPLPDAENAWVLIDQAVKINNRASPANSTLEYPMYPPFGPAWEGAALASEYTNAPVFPLVRQARMRERAQLTTKYPTPLFAGSFTQLSAVRQLANTIADGALHRHLTGDDSEAIERLLDGVQLARAVHQDDGLVSQLVAIGLTALATNRVLIVAPRLHLESAGTRRAVAGLVDALLDERVVHEEFRKAVAFERLVMDDYHRWKSAGTWVLRPLAEQEIVAANTDAAFYAAAARTFDAESARRILENARQPMTDEASGAAWFGGSKSDTKLPRYSRWYAVDGNFFSLKRAFEQRFRGSGERRAAAISLAAQLYRADHDRWPDRLDELVPAYLPAVPADPFHADGRSMGYVIIKRGLPGGGDRPLVYFDAGATVNVVLDTEPMYQWQQDVRPDGSASRREIRQYRDLARWVPPKRRFDQQTSSETVDHDPKQPDAPRDQTEKK